MNFLPRYFTILVVALSCASFPADTHSQSKTPTQAATSSISGTVTIHGKGAPGIVVGVRLSDFSPQPPSVVKATTDQDGSYRVTNLRAGSYQVLPIAPVYVSADLNGRARSKTVLLAEGENVEGIDFSIVRGGVIAGRVTDADGRPVIEERVTVLPENQPNGPGQIFPPVVAGSFQTDDRGIYRIYGVPAGRYKVSVGVSDDERSANVRFGRVAYRRTFYPDASKQDEAKVVEVSEGSETTDIDITVGRNLPTYTASGKVVDGETGQALKGVRVGLRRLVNNREAGTVGMLWASNSEGEFRLENVTPGKYVAFLSPQQGSEVRADAPFEVIDQDVTGLLLKTMQGLTITGAVVLDGPQDKAVLAQLTQLRLQAYVSNANGRSPSWQQSPINIDGSFRLGGLGMGTAHFSLATEDRRPLNTFAIVRVERDGVVQPRGLVIKSGEQLTGIKIVVRYGSGSIRGEVKFENGVLPPSGRIAVSIRKMGDAASNFRSYNVDARGHFLIEGVAAGSYELTVKAFVSGRRSQPSAKQTIEVSEGTVTDVVVTVDLKPEEPGQLAVP